MSTSFLTILHRKLGQGPYKGDQYGGAQGQQTGPGPALDSNLFLFATGIECSYPTINHGKVRRDQLAECGHYERWREDLGLVKGLGLRVLRYGLPYYKIHLGPDRYDWSWADEVMAELQRLGIEPIMDLLHFGVPDWLGNFQNPELPYHFSRFAGAFAERYPWVRFYTPVNEIYVAANFSGREGKWNEQLKSDLGFVTALKHLAAASIMATIEIAHHRPDCIIVQSESAEYTHDLRLGERSKTNLENSLKFLALDLLYGCAPAAETLLYLLDNGMTRAEFDWFMQGEPPGYQIMGNDYYGRNESIILPDGRQLRDQDIAGWYGTTKQYYQRYLKPLMYTETNTFDPDLAPNWLWKQWVNVLRMRQDGVPVLGFTWYSLIDQLDWDTGLAQKNGVVNACGLYDLDRKPRPVAEEYKLLLNTFGGLTMLAHGDVLGLTAAPARQRYEL